MYFLGYLTWFPSIIYKQPEIKLNKKVFSIKSKEQH